MGQLRLGLSKFRSLDLMGLYCAAHHFQIGCHFSCQRQDKNRMGTILDHGLYFEKIDVSSSPCDERVPTL
jgi:hypothetical protein